MRQCQCRTSDAGFSLLEVIVALALIGIAAAAAVPLVLQGMSNSTSIQKRQSAVLLASQALEHARAVSSTGTGAGKNLSGLLVGRNVNDVAAQWDATDASDKSVTWPAWDPAAPVAATASQDSPPPAVPLSTTSTLAGQSYTVSTLIGTCYLRSQLSAQTSGTALDQASCTKRATSTGVAPSTDTSYVALMRVIAVVTWTSTASASCPAGACTYTASALVDPHTDLTWNLAGDLVAKDDTITVARGSTTPINVLLNDRGTFAATNPVTIVQNPSVGTATVNAAGLISYTAPGTGTQSVTLLYTVQGASRSVSNVATLKITVSGS